MNWKCWLMVTLMVLGACAGRATLIAGWNFNGQPGGAASSPIAADHGAGSLDLSKLANAADANIGADSSGTSVNKVSRDLNGRDFYLQAGSGQLENGKPIIFSLSTSGYKNVVLTYATDGTSTGFTSQQWGYSTDGTHFTSFGSAIAVSSGFTAEAVDFSSVTALNNESTVYFTLTLNGATGSSGADHFDNFHFNAAIVPEPAAWGAASGAMSLAFCAFQVWRQHRA